MVQKKRTPNLPGEFEFIDGRMVFRRDNKKTALRATKNKGLWRVAIGNVIKGDGSLK